MAERAPASAAILASWRSEGSRAPGSRRWRWVSRRRSVPSLARSSCAATRHGSVCAVSRSCSTWVPRGIQRRCPSASTPTLAEHAASDPPRGPQRHRRCGVCAGGRPARHRTGGGGGIGAVHRAVARSAGVRADRPNRAAPQRCIRRRRRRRSHAVRTDTGSHRMVPS